MFRYRRPEKRGSLFVGLRITMAITAFIAGASFCLAGAEWHRQVSFYYVNQLPIPWWGYGIAFIIGAIALLTERLRPVGFLIGAVAYSFFSLTVWLAVIAGLHLKVLMWTHLSLPPGTVGSFFAACNLTTICVLYWSALKQAIYLQVDPERHILLKQ